MARYSAQPEYVRLDMAILLDGREGYDDDYVRGLIDDVLDRLGDDALRVHVRRPVRWTGDGRYHEDDDSWLHEGVRTLVRRECPECGAVADDWTRTDHCTGERAVPVPGGSTRRVGPHEPARWVSYRYTGRRVDV
jgi:hypothetical protein